MGLKKKLLRQIKNVPKMRLNEVWKEGKIKGANRSHCLFRVLVYHPKEERRNLIAINLIMSLDLILINEIYILFYCHFLPILFHMISLTCNPKKKKYIPHVNKQLN